MKKQILAIAFLYIGASFVLTTSAHATEATVGAYDTPNGYDGVTTLAPTDYQSIGTFTFTPGESAGSVTITGSFGNGDSGTTALSDYYLGFAGDEMAVEVAACDSTSADCYSGQEGPYTWSATLTQAEITDLAPAIAAGSIDFGYTWGPITPISDPFFSPTGYDAQYVYAGTATLDLTPTPEPGTGLLLLTGLSVLAGLAAFGHFRKHPLQNADQGGIQ